MASFLVLYGTGEGQTAKVADRIVEVLGGRGHDAATNADEIPSDFDVEDFDAVLVGASIHGGKQQPPTSPRSARAASARRRPR